MRFVQTIEIKTSRWDEMAALDREWLAATEGTRTLVREMHGRDRDRPDTYLIVAEFASYEDAMKNNDLPATKQIAERMAKLADGEVVFRNYDLLDDIS
jgi:hypothetical protein